MGWGPSPSVPREFSVLGRQEHQPSSLSGGMVSTLRVWAVPGHSSPGLAQPEGHCLSWLLAASTFRSGVSAFLSPAGGEELSLCKLGGKGVNRETAVTSDTDASVQREEALLAGGSGRRRPLEHTQLSYESLASLGPLPPHNTDLSKEASASLMGMGGLPDSSLGGIPRCFQPLAHQTRACTPLSI